MTIESQEKNESIKLKMVNTWIEDDPSDFTRIVTFYFSCGNIVDIFSGVGKWHTNPLKGCIIKKLYDDIGLEHNKDYIFGINDSPIFKDFVNPYGMPPNNNEEYSIEIRMKQEADFLMMKLAYYD